MTRSAAFAALTLGLVGLVLLLARASSDALTTRLEAGRLAASSRHPPDEAVPGEDVAEGADLTPAGPGLLANVAVSQAVLGAVLLAGIYLTGMPWPALGVADAPTSTGWPALGIGLAVGTGVALVNAVASRLHPGPDPSAPVRALLTPDRPGGWLLTLGVVLPLIAVVEELLFRAALVGGLTVAIGVSPWLLAVLSTVAFGAAHGAQGRLGIAAAGAVGAAFAAVFVFTNSLLAVAVAHYVVDAVEVLTGGPGGAGH